MCGIAGLAGPARRTAAELEGLITTMADALRHRGPDDGGTWVDAPTGVAFGHRRLSVIDLSPLGHQPMKSRSGRWVISYNGELYNFAALRRQLEAAGHRFRGSSDTEVLIEAVDAWGLDAALQRANGMFAMSVWDRERRELHLTRDRLGEKPLYWGWAGRDLVWASELKAIRRHPDFVADLDRDAVTLYLRHNCIPAPYSVYRHVQKLAPGHVLTIDGPSIQRRQAVTRPYWELRTAAAASRSPFDPQAGVEAVGEVLDDAVSLRMVADVGVGALLSGGIDSTLVTALMVQRSPHVKTFTVGFEDAGYDESSDAAAVASHLGTDHTAVRVDAATVQAAILTLPDLYDEPFGDSSQLPTAVVAAVARQEVTVVLSGDGGDELFAGYNRHAAARRLAPWFAFAPGPLRRAASAALGVVDTARFERSVDRLGSLLPPSRRMRMPGVKLAKAAETIGLESTDDLYRRLTSHWTAPDTMVLGGSEPPTIVNRPEGWPDLEDPVERMLWLDQITYLPDDILTKVDRATMAVGLEARVPLLDHRLVELAWTLPVDLKLRGGSTKWILRRLLEQHVPSTLIDRPKMGFGIPLGRWLRHDLRPWAEELLDERALRADGVFHPEGVRAAWTAHCSGAADRSYELWDVLMFQAWLRRWHTDSHVL